MDPDANLAEALGLARGLVRFSEDGQAWRLAELFLAMHDWIDHGGFLPTAWRVGIAASEVGAE